MATSSRSFRRSRERVETIRTQFLTESLDHEMKSEAGLTALIIEGEHVDRFRERPKADP
jgi:hypothetical protein